MVEQVSFAIVALEAVVRAEVSIPDFKRQNFLVKYISINLSLSLSITIKSADITAMFTFYTVYYPSIVLVLCLGHLLPFSFIGGVHLLWFLGASTV